ncbi:unnamed protein product [Echinostoma caproni]|uniref:MARVEL domain-containing protein n=1 Tax=Echinostoma caproni TaxID=27848 RepID=A0A183AKA0_9TREM|nr:unnamed protein product [Echinostoma caproni]
MGFTCTLAPIIQERKDYNDNVWNSECRASVACMFLCFFMFCFAIIILGVAICCQTSDYCLGIAIATLAALCAFFGTTSYATFKHGNCEFIDAFKRPRHPKEIPSNGEWLFGNMASGFALFINSMLLVIPQAKKA